MRGEVKRTSKIAYSVCVGTDEEGLYTIYHFVSIAAFTIPMKCVCVCVCVGGCACVCAHVCVSVHVSHSNSAEQVQEKKLKP